MQGCSNAISDGGRLALGMLAEGSLSEAAVDSQTPSPMPGVPPSGPSKRPRLDRRQQANQS